MRARKVMFTAGTALSLAMAVGACSGGDDTPSATTSSDERAVDQDDATVSGSFELHPSISNLPLPAGYTIPFAADEYSADIDERETVVQLVELEQANDTVAEFLLAELPAAGFTIVEKSGALVDKSEIVAGQAAMLFFENPEGLPGQISINPMPDAGGTSLNINFYRGGDYS